MSIQSGDSRLPETMSPERNVIPEWIKLVVIVVLILAVAYLYYRNRQKEYVVQTELKGITDRVQALENKQKLTTASLSGRIVGLKDELDGALDGIANTEKELRNAVLADRKKTDERFRTAQAAIDRDLEQVRAAGNETEAQISAIRAELEDVKSNVSRARTGLEQTGKELELARDRLAGLRGDLGASVAKYESELARVRLELRPEFIEFTLPDKGRTVEVGDIRLILTGTDRKKGWCSLKILAGGSEIEKKNLAVHDPVQFFTGPDSIRHELVVDWVEENRAGGFLALPGKKFSAAGIPAE
jgi:hypothetical protein